MGKKEREPIDAGEIIFGRNMRITGWTDRIITVVSGTAECRCPECQEMSDSSHGTAQRTVQLVPLHGMTTWAHVTLKRFNCTNPDCEVKVFSEPLEFALSYGRRSIDLNVFVLALSCFLSDRATETICRALGIEISDSTVKAIREGIEISEEPDVEEVGIDDVANRKGQSYYTAIYDMKDHHLIALLDGRDGDTLREWLKDHPKVNMVARDRASAYAAAISEILPDCVQVADRYHLLANLAERIKEIFRDELPERIFFRDGEITDEEPEKTAGLKALTEEEEKMMQEMDYDSSDPLDEDGKKIEYIATKADISSPQYRKQEKKRLEKQALYMKIREEWNADTGKKTYRDYAEKFKVSAQTVKKAVNMTDDEIDAMAQPKKYKTRISSTSGFENMIYKMLRDRVKPHVIMHYVISKGYSGTEKALQEVIYVYAKNNFGIVFGISDFHEKSYPEGVTAVTRGEVLKMILTSAKGNDESFSVLKAIEEKYPAAEAMRILYYGFYSVIMGSSEEAADAFVDEYRSFESENVCAETAESVRKFAKGIEKDIAPVKAAISSDVSSGFVEGNNNKFKVIKRILYGRACLVNLFKKCHLAFACTDIENFSFRGLIIGSRKSRKKTAVR